MLKSRPESVGRRLSAFRLFNALTTAGLVAAIVSAGIAAVALTTNAR
jgi:hypothetical protein